MGIPRKLIEKVIEEENGLRNLIREHTTAEIVGSISRIMDDSIFTKIELAEALGKSERYVTNILEGRPNMSIKELSDILYVMGRKLKIGSGITVVKIEQRLLDLDKAKNKKD